MKASSPASKVPPGDARAQFLRAARLRHAAIISVPVMTIIACMYPLGILSGQALLAIEAYAFVQIAGFLVVGASRTVDLERDSRLTGVRAVGAVTVLLLAALASTTHGRTVPLIMVPVAFSFALYRYGRASLLRLAAVMSVLIVLEQVGAVLWHPGLLDWSAALLQTIAVMIVLITFALVAGQANDYRRRTQFERAMASMALSQMHEAVVAIDLQRRIRSINAGAARLFAIEPTSLIGSPIDSLFHLDEPGGLAALFDPPRHADAAADDGFGTGADAGDVDGHGATAGAGDDNGARGVTRPARAATIRLAGGQRREVELAVAALVRPDRAPVGHVLVARDVGRTNELIRELTHNSTHDALTGLRNRRGFLADLQASREPAAPAASLALPACDETPGVDCLLVIDLDQFKIVNDTCGHGAGDDLLRTVALIVRSHFAAARSVARIGGDEFGLLVHTRDLAECEAQAAGLLRQLVEYRFMRDGRPFRVGASIGIAPIEPGETAAVALAQADAACYVAKDLGRGRVQVYRLGDEEIARQQHDIGWVSRLREAIEQDRLVLFAQRLLATAHESPHAADHYELLLRLRNDDGSLVPPNAFLPAAERFGLMGEIDRWVIARAIGEVGACAKGACRRPRLAINLSASSLRDASLLEFVADCLARHGVDGGLLTFELTESAALLDLNKAREFIVGLKRMGCRVALDDVGTGFSSFSHLRLLPIDQIKIDGSFVRSVCDNPLDRVLVESLQRVADVLGVQTVAEYVEDARIEQAMRQIGVNYLQGYGIHRPEPFAGVCAAGAAGTMRQAVAAPPRRRDVDVAQVA